MNKKCQKLIRNYEKMLKIQNYRNLGKNLIKITKKCKKIDQNYEKLRKNR